MMTLQEEARFCGKLILENKVIIYPTDTIWGIGANLMDPESVQRITKIKSRPSDKNFILLVNSLEMLKEYVVNIHPRVETLLHYHHKPLTIIYPRTRNLPDYILANDQSAAIRICNDLFCKELIHTIQRPLISTSANYSGITPPGNFSEIDERLFKEVDYTVTHRRKETSVANPSVLAKYDESGEMIFLR